MYTVLVEKSGCSSGGPPRVHTPRPPCLSPPPRARAPGTPTTLAARERGRTLATPRTPPGAHAGRACLSEGGAAARRRRARRTHEHVTGGLGPSTRGPWNPESSVGCLPAPVTPSASFTGKRDRGRDRRPGAVRGGGDAGWTKARLPARLTRTEAEAGGPRGEQSAVSGHSLRPREPTCKKQVLSLLCRAPPLLGEELETKAAPTPPGKGPSCRRHCKARGLPRSRDVQGAVTVGILEDSG